MRNEELAAVLAQNEQQDELAVRNEICADRMNSLQDCSNYAELRRRRQSDKNGRLQQPCEREEMNAAKLKERT